MSKMSDFLGSSSSNTSQHETVPGNYGCQDCDEDLPAAYFDEQNGKLYWVCSKGHRTEVNLV